MRNVAMSVSFKNSAASKDENREGRSTDRVRVGLSIYLFIIVFPSMASFNKASLCVRDARDNYSHRL